MLSSFVETILVSLTGGFIFQFAHAPLPWMLGPLTAVMLWHLALKRKVCWPVHIRNGGLIILGYMMGTSFTPETIARSLQQLPTMLFATATTIIFSLIVAYIAYRGAGISFSSSIIGSIPGGLTQMVVLSEEISGADSTVVTFMQTVRMLSAVFIVPFLVIHGLAANGPAAAAGSLRGGSPVPGYTLWSYLLFGCVVLLSVFGAVKLKLPTPFLLGPLLGVLVLAFAGVSGPQMPSCARVAAQLAMGAYMGKNIELVNLKNWKRVFTFTLLGSLMIVLFTFLVGYVLTLVHEITIIDAFLCTAPGGMAEMGLTALLVNGDVSLVTAYQLFRVVFILLTVPPLLRFGLKRLTEKHSYNV